MKNQMNAMNEKNTLNAMNAMNAMNGMNTIGPVSMATRVFGNIPYTLHEDPLLLSSIMQIPREGGGGGCG